MVCTLNVAATMDSNQVKMVYYANQKIHNNSNLKHKILLNLYNSHQMLLIIIILNLNSPNNNKMLVYQQLIVTAM